MAVTRPHNRNSEWPLIQLSSSSLLLLSLVVWQQFSQASCQKMGRYHPVQPVSLHQTGTLEEQLLRNGRTMLTGSGTRLLKEKTKEKVKDGKVKGGGKKGGETQEPTLSPTADPTSTPTARPTSKTPTEAPTTAPIGRPTMLPTELVSSTTLDPTSDSHIVPCDAYDYKTLIEALALAEKRSSISLCPEGNAITLEEEVDVTGLDLSLSCSASKRENCVLDCAGRRCIMSKGNHTLSLMGIEFSNGHSDNSGGALHLSGGGMATFRDCSFRNNTAGWNGGAVYIAGNEQEGARVVFGGCTFEGNSANGGGALALDSCQTSSISNSVFRRNAAVSNGGGAVLTNGASSLALFNSTFEFNDAGTYGGAMLNLQGLTEVDGSLFRDNTCREGIYCGEAIATAFGKVSCNVNNSTAKNTFLGNAMRSCADHAVDICGKENGLACPASTVHCC